MSQNSSKFCPDCSNLLRPSEFTEEKKESKPRSYLCCDKCGYKRKVAYFSMTHVGKKIDSKGRFGMAFVRQSDRKYDPTLKRTTKISCPNKECPSKKEKENPEVVLLTFPDVVKERYLCSLCNYEWGNH